MTEYVDMWKALAENPNRSHPIRNPAGQLRRAISVVPAEVVPDQPRGTEPYWAVQVDTSQQTAPREVLAVRDGVVLYGFGGSGGGGGGEEELGPFIDAFNPAFEFGGGEAGPVYDPLENGVILGIKMSAALIVVVYRNMLTVTAAPGPVVAGDVLGTAPDTHITVGAFQATTDSDPLATLYWATDPLRTVFPTDILWTRNPPRRALV
jgi:hypothetical protein